MRKMFKNRWVLLALIPIVLLAAFAVWVLGFSGSAHVNRSTFRELKLGMTYDQANDLLGGRIHEVKPSKDPEGNPRFRSDTPDDHEKRVPTLPNCLVYSGQ